MPAAGRRNQTGNYLLDRLPEAECNYLLAASEMASLEYHQTIYTEGGPMSHVYFPTRGVVSVIIPMEAGKEVETGTVGPEGMFSVNAYFGLDWSPISMMCQLAGEAVKVPMERFRQAAEPGSSLDQLMRRYAAYSLRNGNQTIACNALHSVEERACRWLLMVHDRIGQDEFRLTHEFLGEMLGVRRQTVSLIAGTLQMAGCITYRRGVVQVRDRGGLEAAACECYETTKALYDRLVGGSAP